MSDKNIRRELLEDLQFLEGLKIKLWSYHPKNINSKNIVEEYDKLEIEIKSIKDDIARMKK
tara:strand:+ start:50 stop:232 length:183 start_codon:yes stop_codon:yes gene_type:complete